MCVGVELTLRGAGDKGSVLVSVRRFIESRSSRPRGSEVGRSLVDDGLWVPELMPEYGFEDEVCGTHTTVVLRDGK